MDIKDIIIKIEQGDYQQLTESEKKQAVAYLQQQLEELDPSLKPPSEE